MYNIHDSVRSAICTVFDVFSTTVVLLAELSSHVVTKPSKYLGIKDKQHTTSRDRSLLRVRSNSCKLFYQYFRLMLLLETRATVTVYIVSTTNFRGGAALRRCTVTNQYRWSVISFCNTTRKLCRPLGCSTVWTGSFFEQSSSDQDNESLTKLLGD